MNNINLITATIWLMIGIFSLSNGQVGTGLACIGASIGWAGYWARGV